MQQPVQNGGGQGLVIGEDFAPIQEALVGRDNQAAAFVATHDQAEEQTGLGLREGQVAEFIQDEQLRIGQLLENDLQTVLMLGTGQAGHEAFQGLKDHTVTGLYGFDAKPDAQVGLAYSWRAKHDHVLGSLDERQSGQFPYLTAIQAGLEVEVELVQGFNPGKARAAQFGLDTPLKAPLPFTAQGFGQEGLVIQLALGSLLTQAGELGFQMVHF